MTQTRLSEHDKPILVALDLSERSEPCLSYGCEMAAKFGQPLILLHVVHETDETAGMYRRHHKSNDTAPLRDIAGAMLGEHVAQFRENGAGLDRVCDVKTIVVDGLPETRILELAERFDVSMIVMCSHNRQGLSRFLNGSVTESVLRRASQPVVVIGPEEIVRTNPHFLRRSPEGNATAVASASI